MINNIIGKIKISKSLYIPTTAAFLNLYSYMMMRKNSKSLDAFDVIGIDGQMLVLPLRLLGVRTERVSFDFTSIADDVFTYAAEHEKTFCVVASTEESIQAFVRKIKEKYPKLRLINFRNGYFTSQEKYEYIRLLVSLNPDFILVGMGSPYQEDFIYEVKQNGWRGYGYTCGGFIHQTAASSKTIYYPWFFDKFHIRWIYRIIREPKLIYRYTFLYPLALCHLFIDFFKK
ncbi:MAG: WecB/TagA/CpsF family glycosyltransferase [Proteobacteria bacterium]|nr:WecB/TagA/CpsF family glycosyltransferase [Pseudomonadota bacterium]